MKIPKLRSRKAGDQRVPRDLLAAAVLIEGRIARSALVDQNGRVLLERQSNVTQTPPRPVAELVAKLLIQTVSGHDLRGGKITAAGLAVDGYVDPVDDRVTLTDRPGRIDGIVWLRTPFKDALVLAMEKTGVNAAFNSKPVIKLTSKMAACVAAEVWTGASRGARNAVFVSLDHEIEAGIIADGRVLSGARGRAGSVGWLPLTETYLNEFAQRGCLSVEVGSRAVVRRTIEAWSGQGSSLISRLSVSDPSGLAPEVIIRAARGGDGLAKNVIHDLCRWIGRGVSSLISILNPEVVIIGGQLGRSLKPFFGEIRTEARKWAEPGSARSCRIVAASLGEKCALIGAARLAFESERANQAR